MNLVQLANDLEYVPKDQLAQMSQDPNASFPSYLVLSEIQRRTQNEKAYAAAQPQPTTTVAEEVVGEFMQPQGLQAGMPPESAPTDVFSSGEMGMPASAPMQQPMQQPMQMASGGLTGYATGDRTSLSSSFADPYSNVGGAFGTTGNPNPDETIDVNTIPKEQREKIVENSKGLTKAQKAIIGLDVAALVLLAAPVPGGRIAAGVTKLASLATRGGVGLKKIYDAARAKRLLGAGQKVLQRDPSKRFGPPLTSGPGTGINPLVRTTELGRQSLRQNLPYRIAGGSALAGGTFALMDPNSPLALNSNEQPSDTDTELSQADKDYNKQMQANILANQQAQLDQNALDQKKANRMFSPTDLIQLGGTVMGARDMSELGQGIAGVAGLSAQRKVDEKQAGLQARYLQAQTSKIEADIASMPLQDALASLKQIDIFLKNINEGAGDATEEQIQELLRKRQFLQQKIAEQQGYDPSMIAGNNKNVIDSYFPNAT